MCASSHFLSPYIFKHSTHGKYSAPQGAENASIPKVIEAGLELLGPRYPKSNLKSKIMTCYSIGMTRIVRYELSVETYVLTHSLQSCSMKHRHLSVLEQGSASWTSPRTATSSMTASSLPPSNLTINRAVVVHNRDQNLVQSEPVLSSGSTAVMKTCKPLIISPLSAQGALHSAISLTRDSLNAYYVFIHPYFPVMPPPVSSPVVDRPLFRPRDEHRKGHRNNVTSDFEPSSPITLAISTILALVPHPDDDDSLNPDSVLYRRKSAHSFAESAMESIEIESEILDSDSSPSRALIGSSPTTRRGSFHPNVPVEIESVIALVVLSIYEYAQRGNITKMRTRAGQALISAMDMSLHSQGDNGGEFAEAKRRAWWMCVSHDRKRCSAEHADSSSHSLVHLRMSGLNRQQYRKTSLGVNPVPHH